MSNENETPLTFHPFAIDLYLRDLVRKVRAQVNKEREELRQKWADCDCGL